jgi:hypothetical protein
MAKKSSRDEEPEDVQPEPVEPHERETIKEKFTRRIKNEKMDNLYSYAKENTRDTLAYFILVFGLILIFFHPFWGEILIGLVAGFYFSDEIISFFKNCEREMNNQGMVRSIVFGGTAIAFFIKAPMIFVAAAVIAGLKYLIISEKR